MPIVAAICAASSPRRRQLARGSRRCARRAHRGRVGARQPLHDARVRLRARRRRRAAAGRRTPAPTGSRRPTSRGRRASSRRRRPARRRRRRRRRRSRPTARARAGAAARARARAARRRPSTQPLRGSRHLARAGAGDPRAVLRDRALHRVAVVGLDVDRAERRALRLGSSRCSRSASGWLMVDWTGRTRAAARSRGRPAFETSTSSADARSRRAPALREPLGSSPRSTPCRRARGRTYAVATYHAAPCRSPRGRSRRRPPRPRRAARRRAPRCPPGRRPTPRPTSRRARAAPGPPRSNSSQSSRSTGSSVDGRPTDAHGVRAPVSR